MNAIKYSNKCGCSATKDKFGNTVFEYCPKHKATDDLYEALEELLTVMGMIPKDTFTKSGQERAVRAICAGANALIKAGD